MTNWGKFRHTQWITPQSAVPKPHTHYFLKWQSIFPREIVTMKILLVCLPRRRLFTNTMSLSSGRLSLSPAACAYIYVQTFKDPRPMRELLSGEWQTSSKVKLSYWIFGQSRNVCIIVKRFVLQVRRWAGKFASAATLLINVICHALIRKLAKRGRGPTTQKSLIKFKPEQESSVVCFFSNQVFSSVRTLPLVASN